MYVIPAFFFLMELIFLFHYRKIYYYHQWLPNLWRKRTPRGSADHPVEGYHPLSVSVPCPDAVPSLCHLYRPFYPLLAAGLHAAFFKCHAPACRGLSH